MTENPNAGHYLGWPAYYEEVRRQTDGVSQQIDVINTRGAALIAQSSALLPIALGMLSWAKAADNIIAWAAIGIAVVAYGFVLGFGFEAVKTADYELRPNPDDLLPLAADRTESEVKLLVANEQMRVLPGNRAIANAKGRALGFALNAAAVQGTALALAFLQSFWPR